MKGMLILTIAVVMVVVLSVEHTVVVLVVSEVMEVVGAVVAAGLHLEANLEAAQVSHLGYKLN